MKAVDIQKEQGGETMSRWQRFLIHGSIWLTAEVVLSLIGLDHLADYSEFLQSRVDLSAKPSVTTVI